MNQRNHFAKCRRWIASMLAFVMALGPLATPGYAALTLLADQPLSVQNQSKPNIMLTIDDSSSMLYDFLPDGAIAKYCRDATGNMNASCGQFDSNVDLSLIGHGRYITPGFIYEQFGFPFPAYNASFDTSGPGAGCDTSILATSTCSGGIDPGALPGIERYPGPPAPTRSPKAGKPYEYWTLWPAPVHNTELNRAYYNPRITYQPPVRADGSSYPQMNAANTINWTHVQADPWATTIKYVDLTAQVTIGFWCNSDWSQGLEGDQRYCRTNGTGPSAASSSATSPDGDYNYPWAPPGIDPTAGSSTAFSIAFGKVDATSHALLPTWATAKDPKYYFQNDNVIWCDATSPLWPNYGPLQPQTCSDPAPVIVPQVCQNVDEPDLRRRRAADLRGSHAAGLQQRATANLQQHQQPDVQRCHAADLHRAAISDLFRPAEPDLRRRRPADMQCGSANLCRRGPAELQRRGIPDLHQLPAAVL